MIGFSDSKERSRLVLNELLVATRENAEKSNKKRNKKRRKLSLRTNILLRKKVIAKNSWNRFRIQILTKEVGIYFIVLVGGNHIFYIIAICGHLMSLAFFALEIEIMEIIRYVIGHFTTDFWLEKYFWLWEFSEIGTNKAENEHNVCKSLQKLRI